MSPRIRIAPGELKIGIRYVLYIEDSYQKCYCQIDIPETGPPVVHCGGCQRQLLKSIIRETETENAIIITRIIITQE